VPTAQSQWRENDGRFGFHSDWDRLCVCGHSLGVHYGAAPRGCCLDTFAEWREERTSHAGCPPAQCGCEKFRPKKSKGKFVYLERVNAKKP